MDTMAAVVTNNGLAFLAEALIGAGVGTLYLAVGTGAGVVSATDTAMFDEDTVTGRTAVALATILTNHPNDTVQATVAVGFPVINETLTEVGLWTAASGGTLIYHRDTVDRVVGPSHSVTSVTFTEQIVL